MAVDLLPECVGRVLTRRNAFEVIYKWRVGTRPTATNNGHEDRRLICNAGNGVEQPDFYQSIALPKVSMRFLNKKIKLFIV